MRRDRDHVRPRLFGDVLGEFEMDGAGPLLLGEPDRFAHRLGMVAGETS